MNFVRKICKWYLKTDLWISVTMCLSGISCIGVIVIYGCYFNGGISNDQNVWSAFGGYVGGVAGTIVIPLPIV